MTIFYSQKDILVTALCKPHKSCAIKGILFYFLEWNWDMRKWKIHTKFKKSTFTIKFNKIPFKSVGIRRMPFPVLLKSTDTGSATLYPRSPFFFVVDKREILVIIYLDLSMYYNKYLIKKTFSSLEIFNG